MIESTHLRYFHEVARTGGFTKAARTIHVQQPAVSRAVRLLEDQLGVRLLVRGKRSVALTNVGKEVFARSQEVMRLLEAIEVVAKNDQDIASGPLRIAAQSHVAAGLMPAINAKVVGANPSLWPMVHTITVSAAVDLLVKGAFEIGVFYHLPAQRRRELLVERIGDVSFALVVRADRAKDEKTLASFIGSREIEDEGTRRYPTLERLKKDYPAAAIRLSCNDAAGQKEMVHLGLGVAVLPRSYVEEDLRRGDLVELYARKLAFPVFALTRKDHPLSRGAELWLAELRAAVRKVRVGSHAPKRRSRSV